MKARQAERKRKSRAAAKMKAALQSGGATDTVEASVPLTPDPADLPDPAAQEPVEPPASPTPPSVRTRRTRATVPPVYEDDVAPEEEDVDTVTRGPKRKVDKSRQAVEGEKQRRRNNDMSRKRIAELETDLQQSQRREAISQDNIIQLRERIRQLEEEEERKKNKLEESNDWFKLTWGYMSRSAKNETKGAMMMAKPEFPPGTNEMLRQKIGVNLSNTWRPVSREESELSKAVKQYAMDNSDPVPDTRKAAKGIRHYHNYRCVLFWHFLAETELSCSYSSFCRLWPANIIKPKMDDYQK